MNLLVYLFLLLPWSGSLDQFGSFGETKPARLGKLIKPTANEHVRPREDKP